MEGNIGRSHITTGFKKVHLVALLYPRVANKHAFESMRGEFREGRRVILDKKIHPKTRGGREKKNDMGKRR